ncbi:hypothetical protein ACG7TL_003711 [Trametes sanguinea]
MAATTHGLDPFDIRDEPLPNVLLELAQYKPLPYPLRGPEADDYFHTWKIRTRTLLQAAGCWDIVDGQDVRPTLEDGDSPEHKEELERRIRLWQKRDHEARFLILQKMADTYLLEYQHCASAKELWDRVCAEHREERALSRVARIFRRMREREYRPGTSYVAHVAKYVEDAAALQEFDLGNTDEIAATLALTSLPEDDEVLKIRMNALLEAIYGTRTSSGDARVRSRVAEVVEVAAEMEIWRSRREEQGLERNSHERKPGRHRRRS